MSDYEKLTDRELDAAVAEKVMGWVEVKVAEYSHRLVGRPNAQTHFLNIEKYSTDDNAARLVRDRIAELGLTQQFIEVFLKQESHPPSMFNVMQQTPREQCIAALMALEVKAK